MIKKLQARGEPRKGRGFGFVTLASEELQQKAVSEMNGKEIEGREIAVKVAIDSPDKTDEEATFPKTRRTRKMPPLPILPTLPALRPLLPPRFRLASYFQPWNSSIMWAKSK